MNPNSRIWLCKTNLENDYRNTLTFSTKNAQRNYFIGDPSDPTSYGTSTKSYSEYTYLRIEQAIKVDDFIENIDTNNYLVLLNNNKYYYYFITSMDYIDEETTKIHIELDVMQTYFFDINYNQTFVEREHVADDTVGKHTIPEGLETGEYIVGSSGLLASSTFVDTNLTNPWSKWAIVMQVIPDTDIFESADITNTYYGGVYSGCMFICFTDLLVGLAPVFLSNMNRLNKSAEVVSVFLYPNSLITYTEKTFVSGSMSGITKYYKINDTEHSVSTNVSIGNKPSTLGSYTPRNKKLLTSDYAFLLLDNGTGGMKKYNYEDFSTTSMAFNLLSTIVPSGSVCYAPQNYKGKTENMMESMSVSKFPVCGWTTDAYTNWLTQTSVNRTFNYGKDIAGTLLAGATTGIGALTGNPLVMAGGITGLTTGLTQGVGDILEDVKQRKQANYIPDGVEGNQSLGDVLFAHQRSATTYYNMHIKEEYAKVIDKFFDMFGYRVNIVKTPSIHTRTYWNYLKTKSCNFTGDIPQEYMDRIKKIFDTGITFWHDPSKMFDYSQTNSILT